MKEIIIPAAKRLETGSLAFTAYEIPVFVRDYYWYLVNELLDRGIKYHKLRVSAPFKPRSTGEKSQNHAINGYCQQIAMELGYDFDTIKNTMKRGAVSMGYPFDTAPDDEIEPWSERRIDTDQAGHLIEFIKYWCAGNNPLEKVIILREE